MIPQPTLATPSIVVGVDEDPIERGLVLDREGVDMVTIEIGGDQSQAWASHASPTTPGMGWMRSVRLKVTDPAFQDGAMPVCDVEIEYLLDAWSGIEVYADTQRGGVRVAGGWGGERKWQTLKFRLDDARFARGDTGDGSKLNSNGHDLIIYGANAPLHIRAVRIKGYDLDHDPDYRRLLRLNGYTTGEAANLMMFTPGQQPTITYGVTNLARRPLVGTYRWDLRSRDGALLARGEKHVTLAAQSASELPVMIDLSSVAYGVYALNFSLSRRGESETILLRESYLGVTDGEAVPKAAEGEFLYGLDVTLGPAYGSKELLQWTRHMGVDIIRHGFGPGTVDEVTRHLPTYEDYGLRVLFMCDPPKDQNRRADELPGVLAKLQTIAARFPQIRYYELGNEPDLTFFYPGPIANYVDDYHRMYDAIKRGNQDAVVMNGGLCFAGAEATRRAEEFVRRVDPERIDAFAYHGHGPGAAAERQALERMQAVANRYGKGGLPLIETESGVAARTAAQEDMQARTVVQKMTYAQSQAMPLFIWFRLLMFEEAYGNLRSAQEPRPSVLAYRHMVQRLRGHAHQATLQLPSGIEGHLFHQIDGPGRVIVLWNEGSGSSFVGLQIAETGSPAELAQYDLYGNLSQQVVSPDGVVSIEADSDPIYLVWRASTNDGFVARAAPSVLEAPRTVRLVAGVPHELAVTLHNAFQRDLDVTLEAAAAGNTTVQATPRVQRVAVAPGRTARVAIETVLAEDERVLHWPRAWTALVHVNPDLDLGQISSMPQRLPGRDADVIARRAVPVNNLIDFEKLGGTMREREAAVVFAHLDSPIEQTVRVGASADWWMAWYVNGKPVYDTLHGGNGGGYAITDHTFDLPLKAGRNLLAVKVLSGSMGWKLMSGSPDALAAALDPQRIPRIELSVYERGALQARSHVLVETVPSLRQAEEGINVNSPPQQWLSLPPDMLLNERAVENLHDKQPDTSLWWQGLDDLSAEGWIRVVDDHLLLVLAVRDDRHVPAGVGTVADALSVMITDPMGQSRITGTLADGMNPEQPSPHLRASVVRTEVEGRTWTVYRASVDPAPLGPSRVLHLHLKLLDTDDGHTLKQIMRLGPSTHDPLVMPLDER